MCTLSARVLASGSHAGSDAPLSRRTIMKPIHFKPVSANGDRCLSPGSPYVLSQLNLAKSRAARRAFRLGPSTHAMHCGQSIRSDHDRQGSR